MIDLKMNPKEDLDTWKTMKRRGTLEEERRSANGCKSRRPNQEHSVHLLKPRGGKDQSQGRGPTEEKAKENGSG